MSILFGKISGAVALVSAVWLSGCMHPAVNDPARVGPFYTPANHSGDASLGGIRRVVLLPLWVGPGTMPESAAALDEVFLAALQQEKRFEVVTISRAELRRRYGAEAVSASGALPFDFFPRLQREFASDAVLFVDLTTYNPYKPITLGLRGKLASSDGSRLIWTFDNIFSGEEPAAANSARRHFLDQDRSVPADLTRTALQSPSRFASYAATAMFQTLPPVLPAVAIAK